MDGRYVPSLLAAIGGVIEQHMIETGFLSAAEDIPPDPWDIRAGTGVGGPASVAVADPAPRPAGMRFCPKCNQPTLIRQEGCDTCTSCGHSKCS
jgi:ribonucleoside-diphosphate reductase alpha chain